MPSFRFFPLAAHRGRRQHPAGIVGMGRGKRSHRFEASQGEGSHGSSACLLRGGGGAARQARGGCGMLGREVRPPVGERLLRSLGGRPGDQSPGLRGSQGGHVLPARRGRGGTGDTGEVRNGPVASFAFRSMFRSCRAERAMGDGQRDPSPGQALHSEQQTRGTGFPSLHFPAIRAFGSVLRMDMKKAGCLHSPLHSAGPEAPGADPHPEGFSATHVCLHVPKIYEPTPSRMAIGMADGVPGCRAPSAAFADFCHYFRLPAAKWISQTEEF